MAELTVQSASIRTTLTPSYVACASGGDTFANNGRTLLHFKNANVGASRTVTISSQSSCNQGGTHDITVTVPADSEEMTGFFPPHRFNDSSNDVSMTYDDESDLTVAAISID